MAIQSLRLIFASQSLRPNLCVPIFASKTIPQASSVLALGSAGGSKDGPTQMNLSSRTPLLHAVVFAVIALAVMPAGKVSAQMTPPTAKKHLYSDTANPRADIAAALKQARAERKRVILDFGGDWCGDCQVLDIYFHQSPNAELLAKHFVVVHVDIGRMDRNLDIP